MYYAPSYYSSNYGATETPGHPLLAEPGQPLRADQVLAQLMYPSNYDLPASYGSLRVDMLDPSNYPGSKGPVVKCADGSYSFASECPGGPAPTRKCPDGRWRSADTACPSEERKAPSTLRNQMSWDVFIGLMAVSVLSAGLLFGWGASSLAASMGGGAAAQWTAGIAGAAIGGFWFNPLGMYLKVKGWIQQQAQAARPYRPPFQ